MSADVMRQLEAEVGKLLRRARRIVDERAQAVHPDLPGGAYLALAHIAEDGPLRASELCTTFELDKGAVSRHVRQLIELGFLDHVPDPEDGRATLLSATDRARTSLEQVTVQRRQWIKERLGEWHDEDLATFVETLRRYNAALGTS